MWMTQFDSAEFHCRETSRLIEDSDSDRIAGRLQLLVPRPKTPTTDKCDGGQQANIDYAKSPAPQLLSIDQVENLVVFHRRKPIEVCKEVDNLSPFSERA